MLVDDCAMLVDDCATLALEAADAGLAMGSANCQTVVRSVDLRFILAIHQREEPPSKMGGKADMLNEALRGAATAGDVESMKMAAGEKKTDVDSKDQVTTHLFIVKR